MNAGVIVQTGQLSRLGVAPKGLQNGSQVLVRIIADKGGGKYEGSVAGARITINSKTAMTPGTSFRATISTQNGQILLYPVNENGEVAQNALFTMEAAQTEQLA